MNKLSTAAKLGDAWKPIHIRELSTDCAQLFTKGKVNKFVPNNYAKTCEKWRWKVIIKKGLTFLVIWDSCLNVQAFELSKFKVCFLSIIFPQFSTVVTE